MKINQKVLIKIKMYLTEDEDRAKEIGCTGITHTWIMVKEFICLVNS